MKLNEIPFQQYIHISDTTLLSVFATYMTVHFI